MRGFFVHPTTASVRDAVDDEPQPEGEDAVRCAGTRPAGVEIGRLP